MVSEQGIIFGKAEASSQKLYHTIDSCTTLRTSGVSRKPQPPTTTRNEKNLYHHTVYAAKVVDNITNIYINVIALCLL